MKIREFCIFGRSLDRGLACALRIGTYHGRSGEWQSATSGASAEDRRPYSHAIRARRYRDLEVLRHAHRQRIELVAIAVQAIPQRGQPLEPGSRGAAGGLRGQGHQTPELEAREDPYRARERVDARFEN